MASSSAALRCWARWILADDPGREALAVVVQIPVEVLLAKGLINRDLGFSKSQH
jgi:hypothetical protein